MIRDAICQITLRCNARRNVIIWILTGQKIFHLDSNADWNTFQGKIRMGAERLGGIGDFGGRVAEEAMIELCYVTKS